MATLSGTLNLSRAVVVEVVGPNVTPRYVVAGTAGSVSGGGAATMGKTDTITQDGAFRSYGNGNVRLILGSSVTRTQTFALRALTTAQIATLQALVGHTVIYCDTYGRRIIGGFLGLQMSTIPLSGNLTDVGLVLQSVTYVEAV